MGVKFLDWGVAEGEDAADDGGVCAEAGAAGGDSLKVLAVYDDEVGGGAVLEGCDLVVGEYVFFFGFGVLLQMTRLPTHGDVECWLERSQLEWRRGRQVEVGKGLDGQPLAEGFGPFIIKLEFRP